MSEEQVESEDKEEDHKSSETSKPETDGPGTAKTQSPIIEVDIDEVDDWREEPKVGFDQRASLEIAKYTLALFALVYVCSFVLALMMLTSDGAEFDKMAELVKFLIGSIVPLATLAVGYYLGDKNGNSN